MIARYRSSDMAGSATLPALSYTSERTALPLPDPVSEPPVPDAVTQPPLPVAVSEPPVRQTPVQLEARTRTARVLAVVVPFLAMGAGAVLLYGSAYWFCYLR
jgi:hypothetical protein